MSRKRPRSHSPESTAAGYSYTPAEERTTAIRNLQALEAELCTIQPLGLQCESRSDKLKTGRLIRLDTLTLDTPNSVWVDRYDARLLLSPPRASSTLSNLDPQITTPPHLSPTGYSDLPSDHEEMFYFEPHERLEIAQKKLRRRREDERSARIKLREEEDKLREEQLRLSKIPPAEQITLMKRTLGALQASPSPSLLEIRILTNHGNDPRFSSFLCREGKWRAYWESMKTDHPDPPGAASTHQQQSSAPKSPIRPALATGGLVDYDDSSEENDTDDRASSTKDPGEEKQLHQASSPDNRLATSSPMKSRSNSTPRDDIMIAPPAPHRAAESSLANTHTAEGQLGSSMEPEITLEYDAAMVASPEPTKAAVDPVERLHRQQRARLWAEKRRKTHPSGAPVDPPPPAGSS
ncbi:hypothetical protein PCASD_02936 [Puccinia coronata f. sp. avenae]|uniref:Uncharacterized protein n=1 Tax=Puccinia coronata f. sp. avenae TaxID=200324 RepID=A0A2N5VEE9_9BASI|nr:hypothetical protein PCASD_02936 [Puccinia coronata f. sp. avenae]